MSAEELSIPTASGNVAISAADDTLLAKFEDWWKALGAEDPKRAKWSAVAEAVQAEMKHRAGDGKQAAEQEPEPAVDLTRSDPYAGLAKIVEPDAITKRLAELQSKYHLVTSATHIDVIPEGFGVSVSMVHVNPADCYQLGGGKVGLGKITLEQIWSAAGGTWDPVLTRRMDNGRETRYVHFRAVGTVRNYDGTPRIVTGEVELDIRDGSDLFNEIVTKAKERESEKNYRGKRDGGASQIMELRKFLLRHAESKAKNRAIAGMGVKRSYTQAELKKPFAVARLTFTGRTDNPVLAERFALMAAEAALGGAMSLYGARSLPPAPESVGHDAPPVGVTEGETWEEPDSNPDNNFDPDPAQGGPL